MSRNVARNLNMSKRYSDYERLKFDYPEERILRITIDRPERLNALDAVGHREITYVWQEIDKDPDVDCVILTGRGKAFSAGGDFEMIEGIIDDFEQRVATWKEARGLVYNVINVASRSYPQSMGRRWERGSWPVC